MKKLFIKTWNFLNNKKTIIGGGVYLLAKGGQLFFPQLLDPAQYEFAQELGAGIAAFGAGHKVVKVKQVNEAISRATQSFKKKR